LFYLALWKNGAEQSYFVPDGVPVTLTFFAAIAAATLLAHNALRPAPKQT